MPNGVPFCTGFTDCSSIPNDVVSALSSPAQTIAGGTNWKYDIDGTNMYSEMSAGSLHTLAIKTDGTLWGWGTNPNVNLPRTDNVGVLGNNCTIPVSTPVQTVAGGTDWKQVSAGSFASGAVKTDGTLWMWGANQHFINAPNPPRSLGLLGDGTSINRSSPVQTAAGGTNWKQVSVGRIHAAAVKTDGTLWTWGQNYYGSLGDGTQGVSFSRSSPVQTVAGGTTWNFVSAGTSCATAAIKTDGTLWLWGAGGLLGNNSLIARSSPVQTIAGGTNWKQVSVGSAVVGAVKTDGTLWLWGGSNVGQLGNNDIATGRSSPVQTVAGGTTWNQVSVGQVFASVSATKTDGTLWTWGSNDCGKLGDGTTSSRSSPVQTVAGGTNWKQVAAGYRHTVAVKADSTLWTWGHNCCNNLAQPLTLCANIDLGLQLVEKDYLIDVYPNLIPTQKASSLWTWGDGNNGALGNCGITSSTGSVSIDSPVQTVAGGTNWLHTGGVKTDGTLWVWGFNGNGELGINNMISQSSPVQTIAGGTNWKSSVGPSYGTRAAIKTDGTLWLWGSNSFGMTGNNTTGTVKVSSPVQTIAGGNTWKEVAMGRNTTASTKTDGTLWMWGKNHYGQIGDNSIVDRSSPVQTIAGGTNWKQVSVGCHFAAAIKTDGTLWAWGNRMGTGSPATQSSPVQTIAGGTNWKQVATGNSHLMAIKTDGSLWGMSCSSGYALGTNSNYSTAGSPVQTVLGGTNWKCVVSTVSTFACVSAAIKTDGTLWVWGKGLLGTNSQSSWPGQTVHHSVPVQTVAGGTNWKQVEISGNSLFNVVRAIRENGDW